MGQMVYDVKLAANGKVPVELIHKGVGAPPSSEEIAAKVHKLEYEFFPKVIADLLEKDSKQ